MRQDRALECVEPPQRECRAVLLRHAVDELQGIRRNRDVHRRPDGNQERARTALRRTLTALSQAVGKEWLEADRTTISLRDTAGFAVDSFGDLWQNDKAAWAVWR